MARLARVEVFDANEIAIVHVMNRTVRRCFLMGEDPLTRKNFDHRKAWMEKELELLAKYFAIDLLCYAIMSNHFHLVLRSRPDVVQERIAWGHPQIRSLNFDSFTSRAFVSDCFAKSSCKHWTRVHCLLNCTRCVLGLGLEVDHG